MTVTYSAEVATSKGFGCFWKLLFRWKGSIYKLLWPDLGLYFSFYYFLSLLYRFALNENQRRYFEKVSMYCRTYGDLIPVSFILGFYVSIVVKRWWDSFNCIPWPDTLAFFVSAYVHGQDDRGRLMRRSIMRYANLAFVITLTCISPCVKKRFPTMDHLVDAGILLPNEKKIMEQLKTTHSTYWMPLVWASSIAIRARKEGRVRDDFALNTLVEAIANYRMLCGGLFNYDWVSIPLVYTQVVTLVVYTFFLATLMGRQYLDPTQGHPGYDVDLYIPVFNFLQFFFYMGWLKVAETLVNPFGEDDDDFEVNWVIDRDIQVSYLIVDEMHQEHPELIKDQYWDEVMPDLPYTAAAMPFYSEPPMGSAANLVIPPHEAEFVPLEPLEENEDELDGVKVVNGIPFETASNNRSRSRLNSHLSGSAFSGISRLGRSFHPMSYERKGILNLMQDFLSREPSVRKKRLWKAPSKDSNVDPTGSCETSGPPTPDEFKDRSGMFNDDIFHLSDLSLADSRAASASGTVSGMHSPSYYSNMPVEDIFWQKRSRPNRYLQRSVSKVSTPKGETPDDSILKLPTVMRKKSTNSLKQFFRSGKYRGSQKSLIGSMHGRSRSKLTMKGENSKDTDSMTESKFNVNNDDKNSLSDEDITVREAYPNPDDMSKSTTNIDNEKNPSMSAPISFSRPRKSLPQELEYSPDKSSVGKLAKESSTSTLVPTEGSLEGTPPADKILSSEEKSNAQNPEPNETFKSIDSINIDMDNSGISDNIKSNPSLAKPTHALIPSKNVFNKFRPKRAVSLHINECQKDGDSPGMSGLQRFFDRRKSHNFLRTMSQPGSPTSSEVPGFKQKPPPKGLFGRRSSKDKQNKSSSNLQLGNDSDISSSQRLIEQKNLKNLAPKSANV